MAITDLLRPVTIPPRPVFCAYCAKEFEFQRDSNVRPLRIINVDEEEGSPVYWFCSDECKIDWCMTKFLRVDNKV
jgi:endogenous inhibitor of DNA gyrase (YacG/DUF329 family)